MKKGKAAGIGIAVIAAAIVFGIASLPDEVLLETPIDASENIPTETIPTEFQPETEPEETEPETPEESEGNVIEIKIRDGIGSGDR